MPKKVYYPSGGGHGHTYSMFGKKKSTFTPVGKKLTRKLKKGK